MKSEQLREENTNDSVVYAIGFEIDFETGEKWQVAEKIACTREECNCIGFWINGDPDLVDEWERVE